MYKRQGMDIETGGHIFQLVFSNSQAMNDVCYFTNANGITEGKGIYFGFNMYSCLLYTARCV